MALVPIKIILITTAFVMGCLVLLIIFFIRKRHGIIQRQLAEKVKTILLERQEEEDAEIKELRREGKKLSGITVMAPHVDMMH